MLIYFSKLGISGKKAILLYIVNIKHPKQWTLYMTLEFSEEENHVSISEMHNKFGKSAPKLMTFIVYFIGVEQK